MNALQARTRFVIAVLAAAFLLWPVVPLFLTPVEPWRAATGLLGAAVFGCLFTVVLTRHWPEPHTNRAPLLLTAMVVLALALLPVVGVPWLIAASYYLVLLGVLTQRARWWPPLLAAVLVLDAVALLVLFDSPERLFGVLAPVAFFGLAVMAMYHITDLSQQVRAAQARLVQARLAEDRQRMTRDLHDLLGQRLSAVSLKSELARALLRRDPERAETELAEVAALSRETLAEVRRTLTGYRSMSLHAELASARALLDDAGVELREDVSEEPLNDELDACAAWIVREGVTNVLRHSHAGRCEIRLRLDRTEAVLSVEDDGPRITGKRTAPEPGLGLSGIRERVTELGASLEIDSGAEAFVLRARFPLGSR